MNKESGKKLPLNWIIASVVAAVIVVAIIIAASINLKKNRDNSSIPEQTTEEETTAEETTVEETTVEETTAEETTVEETTVEETTIEETTTEETTVEETTDGETTEEETTEEEITEPAKVITIGSYFDIYYTSDDVDIYDNPEVLDAVMAQIELDHLRKIEKQYNVRIVKKILTYDEITRIACGDMDSGDCDIYIIYGAMLPYILKYGTALPVSSYASEDSDIYTNNIVTQPVYAAGANEAYAFATADVNLNQTLLAFNVGLLEELGLENPQDLYDRGEWTWDVWEQYMKKISDKGDDYYGYTGFWNNVLDSLLKSNDADIAASNEEHLSSDKTVRVLEFMKKMYDGGLAMPVDTEEWDSNASRFGCGKIGFCTMPIWGIDAYISNIDFKIGFVPFPMGPDAKPGYAKASWNTNMYMIPKTTQDPEYVFEVISEYLDWYEGDVTLRDFFEWYTGLLEMVSADPERDFDYFVTTSFERTYDAWEKYSLGFYDLIDGSMTVDEFVNIYKDEIQKGMDDL